MTIEERRTFYEEQLKEAFTAYKVSETFKEKRDILSAIKELEMNIRQLNFEEGKFELKYSYYETDNVKHIAVWEQNKHDVIRNHKIWIVNQELKQ